MNSHVSLEVAKKLDEAGWSGRSDFWWVKDEESGEFKIYYGDSVGTVVQQEAYPAPTVSNIFAESSNFLLTQVGEGAYMSKRKDIDGHGYSAVTPTDAIAVAWIKYES